MNRRQFLSLSTLATASLAFPVSAVAEPKEQLDSFDFIFFTDTHLEPELNAPDGCAMCFKMVRSLHADFAIQGGDHIYDALGATRQRASGLYDLYARTEQELGMKVHHTIGNHDAFGVYAKSGVGVADPGFGKQMYQERIGPTYYSFDHKGYHFFVLDSIQVTEDRSWEARIDAAQLAWLAKDLSAVLPQTPLIIVVHVPLVTGAASYAPVREGKGNQGFVMNAFEVLSLFAGHNVLAVLQGHTHINEVVTFKGIPFITSGAVCGNWWHGTRWGTPEGFTVVHLRNGHVEWHYETYGFRTVDPQNT